MNPKRIPVRSPKINKKRHPIPDYYENLFEWMGSSCGPPSNFKRWENCATQERSKCSTAIAETLCVQVRPGDGYVCGVLQSVLCMGVVDTYSSINSVALR